MGKYSVELKPSARKELERLPGRLIERVFPKLESLASEPRPSGCKKLKGGDREYRVRVGDYRVVYTVDALLRGEFAGAAASFAVGAGGGCFGFAAGGSAGGA